MSEYTVFAQTLITEDGCRKNVLLHVQNGTVAAVREGADAHADLCVPYLSAGLIDNHIHGGGGFSFRQGSVDTLTAFLTRLAKRGVAGVLLAPGGSTEQIRTALAVMQQVMLLQKEGKANGARLLGAHLEGPFLSKDRPGSFSEDVLQEPSVEAYERIASGYEGVIRAVTLAPELPGASELISHLKQKGVRILAGHTDSGYETAEAAFRAGVGALCHSFNAVAPIHHREPGVITAALLDDGVFCEAICDLVHLHPAIIRLLFRCKGHERLMIISDAIMTTDLPDGSYRDEDTPVSVKDGVSRHAALGCLHGGSCFLAQSLKKLADIGIPFSDAVLAASASPARFHGLDTAVRVGNEAFLSAFDHDLSPLYTMIGEQICACSATCDNTAAPS